MVALMRLGNGFPLTSMLGLTTLLQIILMLTELELTREARCKACDHYIEYDYSYRNAPKRMHCELTLVRNQTNYTGLRINKRNVRNKPQVF